MPLNESKGNMYEFITHTWNTIKGKCPHDCSYCYMKRYKQNPIRFDEKELKTDLGSGNFIFVGSSNDMFADDIPNNWIQNTIDHCFNSDSINQFIFQSKNPKRFFNFHFPDNTVFCTTIETNRYYPLIMKNSPTPSSRAESLQFIKGYKTYITIEPIIDFDLEALIIKIKRCNPKQVNIGADSCGHKLPEPEPEKILELINELSKFTIVHQKNNLKRLLK